MTLYLPSETVTVVRVLEPSYRPTARLITRLANRLPTISSF